MIILSASDHRDIVNIQLKKTNVDASVSFCVSHCFVFLVVWLWVLCLVVISWILLQCTTFCVVGYFNQSFFVFGCYELNSIVRWSLFPGLVFGCDELVSFGINCCMRCQLFCIIFSGFVRGFLFLCLVVMSWILLQCTTCAGCPS